MGWTSPFTATAGTAWKAADWNTYGRDNLKWLATDSPACRAYSSVNVSIPNASPTAVALNSNRYDNATMHSTASNTSRITIPTGGGGKYLIGAGANWALSAGGTQRQVRILQNGTTYVAWQTSPPSASHGSEATVTTSYALAAADYVETYVNQDSGGALNLQAIGNYSPEFWAFWIRT